MIIINLIFNFMFNSFTETELAQERWRDIEGYDGMYQVSDLGRVRSKHSGEWKVMRAIKNSKGYLFVNLYKDGNIKHFLVHRLVAQAFIANNDSSKTLINHKNEIKTDNRVSNLEWCDNQYNTTYNDIHHRRITKRCKIKHLYDPNLSIAENIELFKANGIECGEQTVLNLRRDLKLIQPHPKYKRDKVKSLYNPDLTYNENLDIFKANGVECSRRVIKELRKDLGLIK